MLSIRSARKTDFELLVTMYKTEVEDHASRAQQFADELLNRFRTILCFVDGELSGTITWDTKGGLDDGVIELVGLGVDEDQRRKGIATKLVDSMIEIAASYYLEQGYKLRVVFLFMKKANDGAREFYKTQGFAEVAILPGFYPQDDAVIWTRFL